MSFFDKFPYTNFHELNLDWIVSQLATVKDSMLKAVESAKNAKVSETNAKASEDKAKISETNAKASEDKAKISETNAKASEDKAKISETNAKASEDIAQEAETNASASATKAENIASTLTNWSELDARLTNEISKRETQDNIRVNLSNGYITGRAYMYDERLCVPYAETATDDTVIGGVGYGQLDPKIRDNFFNVFGVYLNLTDLSAGTHTKTYVMNFFKDEVMGSKVEFDPTRMSLYYWGKFLGYTNTPANTRKLVEIIPRESSSLQINSIELIENIANNKMQILVNYTVGANYASTHVTPVRVFFEMFASVYVYA